MKHPASTSDQLWVYLGSPAFALFIYFASQYHLRAGLTQMIGQQPEVYDVDDSGLRFKYANGVDTFTPWSLYSSWEMTDAFLFLRSANQVHWVASMSRVTPGQQEELRSLLTNNLTKFGA